MSRKSLNTCSAPQPHKIAIVDDDAAVLEDIALIAASAGHLAVSLRSGAAAINQFRRDTFDLVLLDWGLPDMTGVEVLRWMRNNLPVMPAVIMITNRHSADDVANALQEGADDYIVKPEAPKVISARIEAVLRRTAPSTPISKQRLLFFGPYCFDRLRETVTFDQKTVSLTTKEFALALLFFQNPHRPLSRAYLLQTIWRTSADVHTRTLDMHVSKIRAKLELHPDRGFRLFTVFGYGYRLERDAEAE
jgi:DNA-binding response OmpR family regulator